MNRITQVVDGKADGFIPKDWKEVIPKHDIFPENPDGTLRREKGFHYFNCNNLVRRDRTIIKINDKYYRAVIVSGQGGNSNVWTLKVLTNDRRFSFKIGYIYSNFYCEK